MLRVIRKMWCLWLSLPRSFSICSCLPFFVTFFYLICFSAEISRIKNNFKNRLFHIKWSFFVLSLSLQVNRSSITCLFCILYALSTLSLSLFALPTFCRTFYPSRRPFTLRQLVLHIQSHTAATSSIHEKANVWVNHG